MDEIEMTSDEMERFHQVILDTLTEPGLLAEFDRLKGTNLRLLGSPLDIYIDISSGKMAGDVHKFVMFVHQCVWLRLKDGGVK